MDFFRYLVIIASFIFTSQLVSAQQLDCDDGAFEGEIYKIVEMMPVPTGCVDFSEHSDRFQCSKDALDAVVLAHPLYESLLVSKEISGSVHLRFIVEPSGCLTNFIIRRDACDGCGDAIKTILKTMPEWTAGKTKSQAVRVLYNYSFSF